MVSIKCPYRYKYELVAWAINHGLSKNRAQGMTKRQLYALWYKT